MWVACVFAMTETWYCVLYNLHVSCHGRDHKIHWHISRSLCPGNTIFPWQMQACPCRSLSEITEVSAGRHHRFLRYHSTVLIASKYELSSARPSADLSLFAPRVISIHIIILHFAFVVGKLFSITEQASTMAAARVVSLGTSVLPLMKTEWTGCRPLHPACRPGVTR